MRCGALLALQLATVDASTIGLSMKSLLVELTRVLSECHPCSSQSQVFIATAALVILAALCPRPDNKRAVAQWLALATTQAALAQSLCFSESRTVRSSILKVRAARPLCSC
jgi:hypothetical protein